jgi:hypothetical protein
MCECSRIFKDSCCYMEHFTQKIYPNYDKTKLPTTVVDMNSAAEAFISCRNSTRMMKRDKKTAFLNEKFRASVIAEVERSNGGKELKMDYRLTGGRKVCRAIFCFAYDCSLNQLKQMSASYKVSSDKQASYLAIRSWTNCCKLHDITYRQSEDLFIATLGYSGEKTLFNYTLFFKY